MKDATQPAAGSLAQADSRLRHWMTVVVGLAAAMLVISLLGPAWLHVPANPAAGTPAMSLSFQDLNDIVSAGPSTGWQQTYFGWLGWALVLIAIAVGAAAWWRRDLITSAALTTIALIGLVGNLFAVKGMLSWGDFIDTLPDVRTGGYLLILGYTLLLVTGIICLTHSMRAKRA